MTSVGRILDANANRAREALRVMEDAARFHLEDADLTEALKRLRHDLAAILERLPDLQLDRDAPGDVGTTIETESEMTRCDVATTALAAGKRLSESLRSLEEYGKIVDPSFAAAVEQLRYRGYTLEQRLNQELGSPRCRQWRLCVLLSESLCSGGDWIRVARQAIEAGADCVQLREKQLGDGELLERARQLVALSAGRAVVIVNDRPDIAVLSGADGVHLGQDDLSCAAVRKVVGRRAFVGVSTTRLSQAVAALRDGADYCGVGPMFASSTKHKPRIAGPAYLREYLGWDQLPHLAIGGIDGSTLDELVETGVRGIAVSSAVFAAAEPGRAVADLLARIEGRETRVTAC